jgi:hypothetical protein
MISSTDKGIAGLSPGSPFFGDGTGCPFVKSNSKVISLLDSFERLWTHVIFTSVVPTFPVGQFPGYI